MSAHAITSKQLAELQACVEERLAQAPRRLAHTLGVADTARALAKTYGVDTHLARAAGLLHDWHKITSTAELVALAERHHIDLGVDLSADAHLVASLLHGPVAAATLREDFPWLPSEVLQAIERHTLGHEAMSDLDMVVFIADVIEPNRALWPGLTELRDETSRGVSLKNVFIHALDHTIVYVISRHEWLHPRAIAIHNALVGSKRDKK